MRFLSQILLSIFLLIAWSSYSQAPVITGQIPDPIVTNEDQPVTISLTNLAVTDAANMYPAGFTLIINAGINYSVASNTITPDLDFNGTLSVSVTVNDGTQNSAPFDLQVQVNAVNDVPTINGQNVVNTNEDQVHAISLSDLLVTDIDNTYPTDFSLIVSAGTNYTFSGNTITPLLNYNGTISVNVQVNDGVANSNTFPLQVNVIAVNDAPDITGQTPNPINATEDTPFTLLVSNLVITDPDNTIFTLTVLAGTNYSFSGNTVTPLLNYNGPLTVNVKVNDGTLDSPSFGVAIQVGTVNDIPAITGQTPNPISAIEDTPFTLLVSNVTISDPDNSMFTLSVLSGTNYTFSGNTITPALNYNGPLTVNVKVNDGVADSPSFGVAVQVAAVNDTPVITGQATLTTGDGQPLTLKFSDLIVSDPDNTYPTGFDLSILSGANYSVAGLIVTPSVGFSGNLTVRVFVNDGTTSSAFFDLVIQVNYINKPPTITGQTPNPVSATEDTPLTLLVSNLVVSDPDNTVFTLIVLAGSNYTFSGNTITPALNFNGLLTVNVKVNDGAIDSPTFGVAVQIAAVNDAPSITSQTPNPVAASEDTPLTLLVSNLNIVDVDNSTFTLSVLAGTNYTFSGNTVTPTLNYNGPLTVNVSVNDGNTNSATFGVSVQVAAVNDAPTITAQTPNPINATQNTPFTILVSNLIVSDPDNSIFTATVLPGSNYTFSGNTVTPALNFNGTLTVNIKANDGSADSPAFGVNVLLSAVNVAPVITGQSPNPIGATEDTPFTIPVSNLTITDPDNTSFTLTVLAGTNYTFSGNTITPSANYNGSLTVNVRVSDGIANSPTFGVTVQVAAVNDAPIITAQSTLNVNEDLPLTILLAHLTVTDPDNAYPTGFTLNVQGGTNYTVLAGTITPTLNFFGNLNVNVTVNDGSTTSTPFALLVKVNPLNDTPVKLGFASINLGEGNVTEQIVNLLTGFSDVEDTPAQLTYLITGNDNPTFFQTISMNQALGQLRFTLNPNAFGTAKLTIRATDTGGLYVQDVITINVSPINDAPSFDVIPNQQVVENSSQQTITINNISKGPSESAQELTFFVSSSNTSIIPTASITYDGVATTAQLKYTIAPNISGTVSITVNAVDNGSNVAPNQNSFTTTFTIEVSEINDPPTLNAITFGPILEDAALQNVSLAGISAGPGESQTLSVTVATNKPELFEILDVVYSSPQAGGTLRIKPKANANGTAQISVRVQDSGPNIPPVSINFLIRSFTLVIQAVNDLPVFVSNGVLTANIGELYTYNIKVKDAEGETLTLTAPTKPTWASLSTVAIADTAACHCNYKLFGTPPIGSGGSTAVKLQVKDPSNVLVDQSYTLVVNTRPTVKPFSATTNEDTPATIDASKFSTAFVDSDANTLFEIQIVTLPKHGALSVNGNSVLQGTKISVASLASGLVYTPSPGYNGLDTLYWNANDGIVYAATPSYINFVVNAVNDAPIISEIEPETNVLQYKAGIGPVILTKVFKVEDVDNDSLVSAEIRFVAPNFRPLFDKLIFTNTKNLTGNFNEQTGVLAISGKAPIIEYDTAIRSIKYNHTNGVDPIQEKKTISFTLNDGTSFSKTEYRYVNLFFETVALDIKNAFTPNGDHSNDEWEIFFENVLASNNPELKDAILRIYNNRGLLLFETTGFEKSWDGRLNGEFVPADTYFYTIDLKLSNKATFKGTVTVLR